MLSSNIIKFFRIAGPIGIVYAWIIIAISVWLNPWFKLTEHAYSDLGGKNAFYPEIYNIGLITTAILMFLFSLALLYLSRDKLSIIGSSWLLIASIFLSLIGIFPSGHRHHVFVSSWFFIQVWISMFPYALSFWKGGNRAIGKTLMFLFVISPLVAGLIELFIGWPSVAILETYGILIIDVYIILIYIEYFIKKRYTA